MTTLLRNISFLCSVVIVLCCKTVSAQSDLCAGATPITCGQTITGNTAGNGADLLAIGCGTNNSPGVWFSFTGTGGNVVASLCGSGFDTYITVVSGTCAAPVCVASNDDFCGLQSQVTFASTAGVTYYINVHGYGTASGAYTLNVSCPTPPVNETCATAIPVSCGSTVTGSTAAAATDVIPAGCLGINNAPGVWYSFVGTGQNIQYSLCGSAFDTQLAIFTGTCGALTCVSANDEYCGSQSQVTAPSTIGVTYYIFVTGWGTAAGNFTLNITCLVPLANETCATAINIACGQTINGTTAGGTPDAIPIGCSINNTSPGVWYYFMGTGGPITASLCGSAFNTQMSLFTGTCGSLNCFSYNDDACGTQSQIALPTTVLGQNYYLYVYGNGNVSGNFTLSLTCPLPPPPPCYTTQSNLCPGISLGADISLPTCTDPCTPVTLTPTYTQINYSDAYTVCGIPYNPYPYNTGTGFSIGVDDVYTGIINLPFNFCFFGTNYSQIKVGSNGLITFNIAYGPGCPWAFTASCPNPALPINSIFGIYHDIDPSILCGATPCGDARYATFGTAPCRVFVVSWDNVPHFSGVCNPLRTTCEIVLYETTNVIEVFVENKPICASWNGGRALIGIQNSLGTIGYTPPNRNTGVWTASYEGWRFTPSGVSTTTITWQQQGTPLGTGTTINVCPSQATQTYAATVTYNLCNGTQLQYSDDLIITCAMIMLPVEWLDFSLSAAPDASAVQCNWKVASERGNHYFTIQRSLDAEHWEDIGVVESAGDTDTERSYSFTDRKPVSGVSYYRIKQTDFDGTEEVSDIRSIVYEATSHVHTIYPNPTSDLITITPWDSDRSATFMDPAGKKINVPMLDDGTFDLRQVMSGTYFVEIATTGGEITERIKVIVE
jgi:hypothetical protein